MSLQEINKLVAKLEKIKTEISTQASDALMDEFNKLFIEYPKMKEFSFLAYTDYFNDGDTCYYSVHADWDWSLRINDKCFDDLDDNIPDTEIDLGQFKKLGEKLSAIIYAIPSDIMQSMYGDHVKITITKDGISTEDYTDHN